MVGGITLRVINIRFCFQYHPDVNKLEGAEDKFKEIANAYEVKIWKSKSFNFLICV